jgi:hypothetical protein
MMHLSRRAALESAIIVSQRGWKGSYSDLEGGSIRAAVAKRKMSSQSSVGKWVIVLLVLIMGIDIDDIVKEIIEPIIPTEAEG